MSVSENQQGELIIDDSTSRWWGFFIIAFGVLVGWVGIAGALGTPDAGEAGWIRWSLVAAFVVAPAFVTLYGYVAAYAGGQRRCVVSRSRQLVTYESTTGFCRDTRCVSWEQVRSVHVRHHETASDPHASLALVCRGGEDFWITQVGDERQLVRVGKTLSEYMALPLELSPELEEWG